MLWLFLYLVCISEIHTHTHTSNHSRLTIIIIPIISLNNLRETMELYCRATDLPFSEDMLNWEPKFFPEWDKCTNAPVWHKGVTESSGFIKHSSSKSRASLNDLPLDFQQSVKNNLAFYEKLKSVSSRPTVH